MQQVPPATNAEPSMLDADLSLKLTEGDEVGNLSSGRAEVRGKTCISGSLLVAGVPVFAFGIQTEPREKSGGQLGNFVIKPGRQRGWVTHAGELTVAEGNSVKGDGLVLEIEVGPGHNAEMRVKVRKAQKKELAALQQERSLLASMEKKKYLSLVSQITKAKHLSCDMRVINEAEQVLKTMEMPESSFLNHDQIRKAMKWKLVTADIEPYQEPCPTEDCSCNSGCASHGELCTVTDGLVQEALQDIHPEAADKLLFKALVRAALAAPEGAVWKSSGKYILSNKEQNQSAGAVLSSLDVYDAPCGNGFHRRALFGQGQCHSAQHPR
jgi:hypothetical protein